MRLSAFLDVGNVWGAGREDRAPSDLRAATGIAVSWDSPVGPLNFSLGTPLKTQDGDKIERFQFQLGRIF